MESRFRNKAGRVGRFAVCSEPNQTAPAQATLGLGAGVNVALGLQTIFHKLTSPLSPLPLCAAEQSKILQQDGNGEGEGERTAAVLARHAAYYFMQCPLPPCSGLVISSPHLPRSLAELFPQPQPKLPPIWFCVNRALHTLTMRMAQWG